MPARWLENVPGSLGREGSHSAPSRFTRNTHSFPVSVPDATHARHPQTGSPGSLAPPTSRIRLSIAGNLRGGAIFIAPRMDQLKPPLQGVVDLPGFRNLIGAEHTSPLLDEASTEFCSAAYVITA